MVHGEGLPARRQVTCCVSTNAAVGYIASSLAVRAQKKYKRAVGLRARFRFARLSYLVRCLALLPVLV